LFFLDKKNTEIYELDLATGKIKQLTDLKTSVGSPEISPDNKYITFHYRSGNDYETIWIMNRDGSNPHEFYSSPGKDVHDAAPVAVGLQQVNHSRGAGRPVALAEDVFGRVPAAPLRQEISDEFCKGVGIRIDAIEGFVPVLARNSAESRARGIDENEIARVEQAVFVVHQ